MSTSNLLLALLFPILPAVLACGGTPTAEATETYGQTSLALADDAEAGGVEAAVAVADAADPATDGAVADEALVLEASVAEDAAGDAPVEAEGAETGADGGEAGAPAGDAGVEAGRDGGAGTTVHGSSGGGVTASRDAAATFGSETFDETHFSPSSEGGCSTTERSQGPSPLGLFAALAVLGWVVVLRRRR